MQPLVLIAEFAARQGIDLYSYKANAHTLRDAIIFFGRAVDDPRLIQPYTPDCQAGHFSSGDFAEFAFYTARFGDVVGALAILNALQHPTTDTRIGGCTTIPAAK